MDGYGRRDVNGKANAGLTLGIIGTALGAWALFGNNRRSTGLLGAAGINYVDRKTCNVIYGVTVLPNEPTTTGLVGRNANGCLPCGMSQTTPAPAA